MKISTEQKTAIEAPADTCMLVEAVPGAGKTEVLARRLAYLIKKGIGPAEVMVLSFSNAAVRTLISRLRKVAQSHMDEVDDLRHVSVRTFDSWAFRLLVSSGKLPKDLLRRNYEENIQAATEAVREGEAIQHILSGVKHVLIDEVQDLTGARAELALAILERVAGVGGKHTAGFTLLGDRHQGIYGFSVTGARTDEFIERIAIGWGRQLRKRSLTVNYRLAKDMVKISAKARKALDEREGARALEEVRKVVASFPKSSEAVEEPSGSTAILCRTNAQAMMVAEQIWGRDEAFKGQFPFLNAGDQVKSAPAWVGRVLSPAVDTKEISRELFIQAYAQLLSKDDLTSAPEPTQAWAFLQKCLKSSPEALCLNLDILRERLSWSDFLPDDDSAPPDGSLEITTIHQSKGREFDNVVLLDAPQDSRSSDDEELREEARLLYVAMTRSRRFVKVWTPERSMDMYPAKLWDSRVRLMRRQKGAVIVEGGLRRDISKSSFIENEAVGGDPGAIQEYLWRHRDELIGRKVVLVKVSAEGPSSPSEKRTPVYRIHLQKDTKPDMVLGAMTPDFSEEVLGAYKSSAKRYNYPARIYNLRVSSVCTYSALTSDITSGAKPWSQSGFWLGVSLTGLAYFKTFKN